MAFRILIFTNKEMPKLLMKIIDFGYKKSTIKSKAKNANLETILTRKG